MKARLSLRKAWLLSTLVAAGCGGEGTTDRYATPAAGSGAGAGAPWEPAPIEADSPVARHGHLRVEAGALLDESGAAVQLKGVSTMWLNWEQNYAGSKDGLRWLRDNWGLSVVRAAMGVEPDNAYLANPSPMLTQVRTVVRNAIDLGVYVIIDWHDHTAHEHTADASEFFAQMAEEFGEYPNVLYETYNEPMQVDWSTVVKPYHEVVAGVIRERDADNVIILGTPIWSQAVNVAAQDPVAGSNLMYTVHFYSCDHRGVQRQQAIEAANQGIAIFVTEWGATTANGGTDPNGMVCVEEAQLWHDLMNERQISWTAWKLDDCQDLSCLFRPQAPRTGGWDETWLNGHGPFVRDRMLE